MKISVIIPCFNGAKWLADAVASVVGQGIEGTEIIVVDDVSSDDSVKVAEDLGRKFANLSVLRQAVNGGPAKARNAGLRKASGKYVCFLDADDAYGEGVFARALAVFAEGPWVQAVYFPVHFVNNHRDVHPLQHRRIEQSLPSTLIVQRELAEAVGGFPESEAFRTKQAGEDVTFRFLIDYWANARRIDDVFLKYTVRRGGHFDAYLDRSRVEDGQILVRPDEADAIVEKGAQEAIQRGIEHLRSHFKVGETRTLQLKIDSRLLRFETLDDDASFQQAQDTLQGKIHPKTPFLQNVSSVLDIGANIGASAALFAHRYPSARIVAVESSRKSFVLLRSNSRSHPRIECFNVGLSDRATAMADVQLVPADDFVAKVAIARPDIIRIATGGHDLPILDTIAESFRTARAVYFGYRSEEGRRAIDRLLSGTHTLFFGSAPSPHRGDLMYVRNDALPAGAQRS